MEAALTLTLLLAPCLTHACSIQSVTQNPTVLATLTGREVEITCAVGLTGDASDVTCTLEHAGYTAPSRPGPSHNTTWTHHLHVTERPDVYYCKAACGGRTMYGRGTYIYVRDLGYAEPSSSAHKLCCGLIALFILLLLLAGSGTYLVLPFFWKRKDASPPQTIEQSSAVKEMLESRPVVEDAGSSLYTSLEPRSEEVYDVLEDETKIKPTESPKKHQVEIHEAAGSPGRRPQAIQGKPPIRPKLKERVPKNTVYENFKR